MVLIEVFVNCVIDINVIITSHVNSAIILGLAMGSEGEFRKNNQITSNRVSRCTE